MQPTEADIPAGGGGEAAANPPAAPATPGRVLLVVEDDAAFARTLPTLITSHRDFLLFLDMAKVLGTIFEKPTMPGFPSVEERRQPRRYYAVVDAPDRDLRQRIVGDDGIARGDGGGHALEIKREAHT